MKTPLLALAAILTAPLLFAQEAVLPAVPLIYTSGSAVVRVVPDLADLSFEVEVRNADLVLARKLQGERAQKILGALRAAGVAETELQSSQVQIAPNYTDGRQEGEQVRFYRVWQTISGTLHDVKKVPDTTANVVLAGATSVREISLRTSQLRVYRDKARALAIRAAKEKATALAAELGAKIGRPHSITEIPDNGIGLVTGNGFNNIQQVAPDAEPGDGTIPAFAPGSITVTASISVAFRLE
ncbi:MAG: SIMPL domain-containing protein [Chthoniobacter sp.]|uniref:SIMPL domain-containing protein n=1 Tax=Chthoniobacter sp. TaxID=2510640 RepID=UPI0032A8E77A